MILSINPKQPDREIGSNVYPSADPVSHIVTKTNSQSRIQKKACSNGIITTFKALNAAKKLLREAYQATKKDNELLEKRWEKVTKDIADEHKKASSKQNWISMLYILPPMLEISGAPIGQWLKSQNTQWWRGIEERCNNIAHFFPSFTHRVTEILPGAIHHLGNTEEKDKTVKNYFGSLSSGGSQIIQGFSKSNESAVQEETIPMQMQSQATQTLYQTKNSDNSSEKQQLAEVDRMMQDLMRQESQVFQGNIGRA